MPVRLLPLLALLALGGCGSSTSVPPPPPPVPAVNTAPSARILAPLEGTTLRGTGPHTLTGTAQDAEDGTLEGAALRWSSSRDGVLGSGSPLEIPLSAGEHRLSLDVTDSGGLTARAQLSVTVVVVEELPPVVTLEAPVMNAVFDEGLPLLLRGQAWDPETGALPGSALTWSSDRDGVLGTGEQLSFTGAARGAHRLVLTAVNPRGQHGYASVTVNVVPAGTNRTPSVVISQPTEGAHLLTTQALLLEGSATDAEEGALGDEALEWSSSRSGVLGKGRRRPGVWLPAGVHTLTLTATDSRGATGRTSVLVSVTAPDSSAPTVHITRPAPGFTLFAGTALTLEGTATDGKEGALSGDALRWSSSLSGPLGTGSPLTVPRLPAGSHELLLTARNAAGSESAARIRVEVLAANRAPLVSISSPADGASSPAGSVVFLSGTGDDPEDGPLTGDRLTWRSSLAGLLGRGASLTVGSLGAGLHHITLTALDSGGRVASASIQLRIEPSAAKLPPVARLTGPGRAEARREMLFSGADSSDPDGTITRYRFDFGDATAPVEGQDAQRAHTYAAPGRYTVTLEVTDNEGQKATDTRTLQVAPYVQVPEVVAEGYEGYGSACGLEMRGAVAHLVFRGLRHATLWYGERTATSWTMEQVDGPGFNTGGVVQESLALAVSAEGAPHVAYFLEGKGLWYATRSGGRWRRERVDAAPAVPGRVSIALDPSQGHRPTLVYDGYSQESGSGRVRRIRVASRTADAAWSSEWIPFSGSSGQAASGGATFGPDGTLYMPYNDYFLGAWNGAGAAQTLPLASSLGSVWAATAWLPTGPLLFSASSLRQVMLREPFSDSRVNLSQVEDFSISQLALAVGAAEDPRLAFVHGQQLEVARLDPVGRWSRTENLSRVDAAEIDAAVDAQDETRVCFFRDQKLMLY